ncbi:hypothetical protein DPSP01_011853 [Paraphaeosphaeria sporulosa]
MFRRGGRERSPSGPRCSVGGSGCACMQKIHAAAAPRSICSKRTPGPEAPSGRTLKVGAGDVHETATGALRMRDSGLLGMADVAPTMAAGHSAGDQHVVVQSST